MDFNESKEQIRQYWACRVKGESLAEVWANQRKCSFKNPEFWKVISWALRKLVFASFGVKLSLAYTFADIVHRARTGTLEEIFAKLAALAPNVEMLCCELYRGSSKGFVPLPDVEVGGCARNDSLIAPAI
ncbi:hypothetical protein QUB63_02310 [Microcoleus sp. ARI1-B5]|uniref:hypothetical protein n=1 Tax=unclassified Microcoleus TaxID=2642155 RepID=UPI002FD65A17